MTTRSQTRKTTKQPSTNIPETTKKEDNYVFFWKPDEPNGELGQWFPSPFTFNDKSFATAEQFMMYCKALIFNDSIMAETILDSMTSHPSEHKKMGRGVSNFNGEIWDKLCMNVVVIGNICKFTQNPDLLKMLMQTGGEEIVEASSRDRIWGIGYAKDNALKNIGEWGTNKLGQALMIVRKVIADRASRGVDGPVRDVNELMDLRKDTGVAELDVTGIFE